MSRDIEVSPQEEEDLINKVANRIHQYDMNIVAIPILESLKPICYLGSLMGRFFLSPILPSISENANIIGEKALQTFENRANLEKLIVRLEEMDQEKRNKSKAESMEVEMETKENVSESTSRKKGWRRFFFL